jgi:hypothetical protein
VGVPRLPPPQVASLQTNEPFASRQQVRSAGHDAPEVVPPVTQVSEQSLSPELGPAKQTQAPFIQTWPLDVSQGGPLPHFVQVFVAGSTVSVLHGQSVQDPLLQNS